MQYSQINSDAPNAVSSAPPPNGSSHAYSLKHVIASALCAAVLTAVTLHAVAYRPVASAPRALPALSATGVAARGFSPNNRCATTMGKGTCAGLLTEGHSFVYRQCSNDLGGARPSVCECGGYGLPGSGGEKPYVLRHVMQGPACVCEFHTGTPGETVWTMTLKCA